MRSFLSALYPDGLPDDTALVLFVKDQDAKGSHLYPKDLDELCERAEKAGKDVYFTAALQPPTYRHGMRAKASEARGIPGFWCDFDFAKEGSRKSYFTDEDGLRAFIDDLPMQPTLLVHTGGGMHAWWLFKEEWVFENDRSRAARLARGWARFIQREAKRQGVDVDSTFDLSRILRLPGTLNYGYDPPRAVELVEDGGPRYNPSDFEIWEAEEEKSAPELERFEVRDGAINAALLEALFAVEPRARRTWERKRKDLGDQSQSAYDLSLANDALIAGWTYQETVDLLVSFRERCNERPKHTGYYELTLRKAAILAQEVEVAEEETAGALEQVKDAAGEREAAMTLIRDLTSCPVDRIVAYGVPDEVNVVLWFGDRMVPIGGGFDKLLLQPYWIAAAVAARVPFEKLPPSTKKTRIGWDQVQRLFKDAWEEGADVSDKKAHEWLEALAMGAVVVNEESDRSEAVNHGHQFVWGGRLYVRQEELLRVARQRGARWGVQSSDIQIALDRMTVDYESVVIEGAGGVQRRYESFGLGDLPASITQHIEEMSDDE